MKWWNVYGISCVSFCSISRAFGRNKQNCKTDLFSVYKYKIFKATIAVRIVSYEAANAAQVL